MMIWGVHNQPQPDLVGNTSLCHADIGGPDGPAGSAYSLGDRG